MANQDRDFVIILGFGGVLLNTLPLWLGHLVLHPMMSDQGAGVIGSVTLLLAASACGWINTRPFARWAWPVLMVSLLVFELTSGVSLATSVLACCAMGLSMGAALSAAFARIGNHENIQGLIATAMSLGLVMSLLVYLIVSLTPFTVLWVLLALAAFVFFAITKRPLDSSQITKRPALDLSGMPLRYMAFFVMMGAYWAFLELYGRRHLGVGNVELWLLGSLIASAVGSALAARVDATRFPAAMPICLALAAVTGAATYWTQSPGLIGASILANGFFLFLFFPLYLAFEPEQMPKRMALYLAGFAFGGVTGALFITIGGFGALSLAIALSGWIGITEAMRKPQAR